MGDLLCKGERFSTYHLDNYSRYVLRMVTDMLILVDGASVVVWGVL